MPIRDIWWPQALLSQEKQCCKFFGYTLIISCGAISKWVPGRITLLFVVWIFRISPQKFFVYATADFFLTPRTSMDCAPPATSETWDATLELGSILIAFLCFFSSSARAVLTYTFLLAFVLQRLNAHSFTRTIAVVERCSKARLPKMTLLRRIAGGLRKKAAVSAVLCRREKIERNYALPHLNLRPPRL